MIWRIVRKELLVNLLSARFALGLVITVAMMGIVGYVLMGEYAQQRQEYIERVQSHRDALKSFKVYSVVETHVDVPPSPLSIFSRRHKDLPASAKVSPYHIPSLVGGETGATTIALDRDAKPPTDNPLLRIFSTIDLAFVISTLLSLFALLLVFDSFSGEREQGTLPMIMACPVGRLELLAGKFLGALITLSVPLGLGFLTVLLMWSLSPVIELDAAAWTGIGAIFLVSLTFLAGFAGLGLLVSLRVQESASGLMYLLLAWVVIVVAIPEGGGYLAQYARPQVSRQRFVEGVEKAQQEFYRKFSEIGHQQKGGWTYSSSGDFGGRTLLATTEEEMLNLVETHKKRVPLKFRFAEDRYRVVEEYEQSLRRWLRLQGTLVAPSLSGLYRKVVQALAATDVESYDQVLRQLRRYRADLVDYLRPKIGTPEWFTRMPDHPELFATEENVARWRKLEAEKGWGAVEERYFNWERIEPLDLSGMPRLRVEYPDLAERVEGVTGDILLLVGMAVLLLGLAWRQALRYAVR